MDDSSPVKSIIWVGSSRMELKALPSEVQDAIGYALYQAQLGQKASEAKPLHGFGGAGVLEVIADFQADAYRAVYTVKFPNFIYVLHVFQKKSKKGRSTPKPDIDLIKKRLRVAEQHFNSTVRKYT